MPVDWHTEPDLQEWIDLGYASVPLEADEEQSDAIVTAYTYYRGYRARADTLLGSPDNVGQSDMSVAQSNGRYDRMVAQAEAYLAEWQALVAGVLPEPEPEAPLRVSRSTYARINFHWV